MKKRLSTGPGLVIGIPTLGRPIPLDWAFAFKSLSPPINYNCIIQTVKGQEVAAARNLIANVAIEKDAKYLFFLGDDVVVPPHTLKQLIYRLENNDEIDVVGGVYCSKCEPSAPLVFRGNGQGSYWDWKIGEFFPVTGMGMDCTLIRVSLFKELQDRGIKEFFRTVDKDQYLDGKSNAESWTEDLYFFQLLEDEGIKDNVYIDASVICQHWDIYGDKAYTLPTGSLPMRQLMLPEGKKRCLMIGAEKIPINTAEESQFEVVYFGDYDIADYRGNSGQLPFESKTFDWVIVNEPWRRFHFLEWERVTKPGGKLTVRLPRLINITELQVSYPDYTIELNNFLIRYFPNIQDPNFVRLDVLEKEMPDEQH